MDSVAGNLPMAPSSSNTSPSSRLLPVAEEGGSNSSCCSWTLVNSGSDAESACARGTAAGGLLLRSKSAGCSGTSSRFDTEAGSANIKGISLEESPAWSITTCWSTAPMNSAAVSDSTGGTGSADSSGALRLGAAAPPVSASALGLSSGDLSECACTGSTSRNEMSAARALSVSFLSTSCLMDGPPGETGLSAAFLAGASPCEHGISRRRKASSLL
mmetsp:Transcript_35856/g.90154  ORF Transcript_35856/g.90154 Transcript_35856/m.90154 type:complete len:216 (-) Transcript_35856:104-751(-)